MNSTTRMERSSFRAPLFFSFVLIQCKDEPRKGYFDPKFSKEKNLPIMHNFSWRVDF